MSEKIHPLNVSSLKTSFLNVNLPNNERIASMKNFLQLGGQLDKDLIYSLVEAISKHTQKTYWKKDITSDGSLAYAAIFEFLDKVPDNLKKYSYENLERIPLIMESKELRDIHVKMALLTTYFRSTSKEKI